ncbi:insulinase family protein [Mucilaginibacter sp. 14171R-50]|uniref:M16 family metallopeptidase n=1 Tax=Mucilaginibacter sp. 14171R-50 TaxID=2703789 RepID=UPI00138B3DA7|nr:pitrilysin family protein [Mucilaginibacter sp. 14171R-50]QHS57478.1 insulinase family protein [Mucilaginibacter sp. 14171R-50]
MNKTFKCALLAQSVLVMALTANAQTAAQPKLVEKVTRKGTELVIPYEKYVLPNGLTVILAEDHSDPLVHVDVTYHVGSAREEIGKSGFAHFFEHMMFQGSDHVANGDHFKIITESGGTLNGSTNRDRTNYYETVPANQLEKMLWLESDRMGFLLDAVTQQKFEVQRATVKNERGQNYDNRPYGLAGEYTSKNLYPYGHPYSWLTIGYIEELNKVGVNDLKNFFLRWYGPNNATITIGGDLNPKQTLALVSKYFGSIPRGPVVKNASFPAPVLTADRYVSYTDNYAKLPLLSITYPGVKIYDKDMSALDALSEIIGQGRNSIFYKNFVKTRKAAQASMNSSNTELAGEISMRVIPFPGQTLADAKKLIDESLAEFEKTGVTDDALVRFKASAEANAINGLSSVSGKVSELAQAQYLTGNPNQIGRELADIQAVTKEDVMRVYNKYIKGKPAVILSVLPKGGTVAPVAPDNYTVSTAGYKAPDYGYNGLTYKKPADNFDRAAKPGIGANPAIKVPAIWMATTPNGIKMIGTQNKEIPTVSISMSVKGGGLYAINNPEKAGLAGIVARMMNEETKNYTAEQFNSELDKLGSNISVFAGSEAMYINVSSLTKNLPKTMTLLQERLFNPKFTQDALDRIKKQTIEGLKQAKTQPAGVASTVYSKILYGTDNVRTYSTTGNEETVAGITLQDVQDYYDKYFTPSQTEIVVVGDVNQGTARGNLAFLNAWADKKVTIPTPAEGKSFDKTTLYLVDIPGAAQSEIRIGYLDKLNYDAIGDYYKLGIANYILGGAFNSHINLNLREKKGWTYGARSGFSSGRYGGDFTASAGVLATATDSSVYEFIKEIRDYQKTGITPDELKFTQTSIGQSDARKYETNGQKAAFLSRIQEYDLKPTYVDEQNKILSTITPAELNALSAKYLNTDNMVILVVGDKARILPGLQKLGYPIVELDSDGKPKM